MANSKECGGRARAGVGRARQDRYVIDRDPAIHAVIAAAFGREDEADLVDRLLDGEHVLISMTAKIEGRIVGHILFSRMWIDTAQGPVAAVALAPLAVLPQYQRKGFGGHLIRSGIEILREQGEKIVIVVGHPDCYPRFGFSAEKTKWLTSPFPPEAFMAMELVDGALEGIRGPVVYPPAFGILRQSGID